jgi:uncharacterized membrane protein YqgA involved in biofilm formation
MVGTIVNAAAIILGSLVGLLFKKGIPERVNKTVMRGLALCVILIGLMDALKVNNLMIVIFSIVIGGIAGELLNINDRIKSLGDRIGKKFSNSSDSVSKGFVTSSLLFCVGAMAIVGSLEDGLTGNHKLYLQNPYWMVFHLLFSLHPLGLELYYLQFPFSCTRE